MNWNKRAALAAFLVCASFAQPARADDGIEAVAAHDFAGWKIYQQVSGDLNRDGKLEVAAILSRPAEGTDENGQAMLAVYLNNGEGGYKLLTQSPKAICVGCGGPKAAMGEPLGELSISKNLLNITYEGGSREAFEDEVKWRFDTKKKDFLLIGETRRVTDTLGGDPEETLDINYLTLKAEKKVGKKKHACAVGAEFKAVALSTFDYDGKHIDDLEKLSEACDKH